MFFALLFLVIGNTEEDRIRYLWYRKRVEIIPEAVGRFSCEASRCPMK